MIEGMVEPPRRPPPDQGGSLDEWARLIRAYTVLHQADKAKAALADARKALAPDTGAVASLDALARDLGLGGRKLTRKSRRLGLIAAALAIVGCAVGLGAVRDEGQPVAVPEPGGDRREGRRAGNAAQGRGAGRAGLGRSRRRPR